MSNLPISFRNAAAVPKASVTRRGVWLVVGWLAFSLGTVVYPCQVHHTSPGKLNEAAAFEVISGARTAPANVDSSPAHGDGTCYELTAPAIGVPVAAAVAAGNTNSDPPGAPALDVQQPLREGRALSKLEAAPPLPHTPLFLTTQRLLI